MKKFIYRFGKFFIIGFAALTILFTTLSIATVNTSTYKSYKTNYNKCLSGYVTCSTAANKATNYIVKASYKKLMEDYDELMDFWKGKMAVVEAKSATQAVFAVLFFLSTGGAVVVTIIFSKKYKAQLAAEAAANEAAAEEIEVVEAEITEVAEAIEVATEENAAE